MKQCAAYQVQWLQKVQCFEIRFFAKRQNVTGYAALKHIKDNPDIYKEMEEKSSYLENGFKTNLSTVGKNYAMNRIGSMMCMFFTENPVNDFKSALTSDTELYGKYFHEMLNRGIYLAPAQFEALFVSTAHSKEDLDKTISIQLEALRALP